MKTANIYIDYAAFGGVNYIYMATPLGNCARRIVFGVDNEVASLSRNFMPHLKLIKRLGWPHRLTIGLDDL